MVLFQCEWQCFMKSWLPVIRARCRYEWLQQLLGTQNVSPLLVCFRYASTAGCQTNLSYLSRAAGLERRRGCGSHGVRDPKMQRKSSTCWLRHILAFSINMLLWQEPQCIFSESHAVAFGMAVTPGRCMLKCWMSGNQNCRKQFWLPLPCMTLNSKRVLSEGDNWGGEDGQDGSPVPRKFSSDKSSARATCCQ